MFDNEFNNKQRHDLALAWASAVFNKNLQAAPATVAEQVQSLNDFHKLYIWAYRECSNWTNAEFDSVAPEK